MNYQQASQYWKEKEKGQKMLSREEQFKRIEDYILSHNTAALATGYGEEIRCTPLEYNYYDHAFYIFTEGGLKFKYLEHNNNVAMTIFENYTTFNKVKSVQIQGKAEIIEPENPEFDYALTKKGLNAAAIKKTGMTLHVLKIVPTSFDYLDFSLKQEGYFNRQHYDC